jgi:phosphonate transport system substrate-binding protein
MLRFTSCQAPSADRFCAAVTRFVGERLGIPTEFVDDVPWQERERLFDRGEIDVCWMCGWPYALRADSLSSGVELLAAPVMAGPRYADQPVYFSDIVVHADSAVASFTDLRGATWAFNEPMSHSGYMVVRHFLAGQNIRGGYFGLAIHSGSHAASLDLILNRSVDGTAIDSTVLEAIVRRRPEIMPSLRIVDSLGPSPAPPWVLRSSMAPELRAAVRTAFTTMHESAEGGAILREAAVRRFAAVTDTFYDAIRDMAAAGAQSQL